MKIKNYIYGAVMGLAVLPLASCENSERVFPDNEDGTIAYFAYQFPVRTIVLGNDIYDNSLDNAHKCKIWATMGGAYNGRDAIVDFVVDPTLCENLYFVDEGGNPDRLVQPMPAEYYTLASSQIPYNGDLRGWVEVQLTDAFFNDPKAVEDTYVIPLLMKSVKGIDNILTGTPREGLLPSRTDTENWDILAKDYVLYCVKYMNPWQGKYIRRGVDYVTEGDNTTTVVRKDFTMVNSDIEHYKENPVNANDEVCGIATKNMTQAIFPVSIKTSGASKQCNLLLTFNGNKCIISTEDEGIEVSGEGEFIANGTEQEAYKDYRWGNLNGEQVTKRDILRLSYTVDFGSVQSTTADTLVVQTRESNKREFFSPKYVK